MNIAQTTATNYNTDKEVVGDLRHGETLRRMIIYVGHKKIFVTAKYNDIIKYWIITNFLSSYSFILCFIYIYIYNDLIREIFYITFYAITFFSFLISELIISFKYYKTVRQMQQCFQRLKIKTFVVCMMTEKVSITSI